MSKTIFENINDISTHIINAYSKCEEMGADMPEQKNSKNLADTISTIHSGADCSI